MKKTIRIPRRLDEITSLLDMEIPKVDLSEVENCRIDFTGTTFGEPLPMLLLGREIRALMRANVGKSFSCTTKASDFRGYADHVGFFRYCGFMRGNEIGAADGSGTYVPIQLIDLNRLKETSGDRPYVEIVEEKSDELARTLLGSGQHRSFNTIRYAIREIMRNSAEHSFGGVLVFFGQYWPQKSEAEIAIFDTGIGVAQALADSGIVEPLDKFGALETALMPGVTGVSEAERAAQDKDTRNSGFGLYVTSRYCSENGIFRIISKGAAISVNKERIVPHHWRFDGTCVQMKLKTDRDSPESPRIFEIIREGEAIAEAAGRTGGASSASKSLSLR